MRWPRSRSMLKCLCYAFIALVVVEFFVFNAVVLVVFISLRKDISAVMNAPGHSLLEKLMSNHKFQTLVDTGKHGGFSKILQETLGRLYIMSNARSSARGKQPLPEMSILGLDVSNAGEAMYLYRRIQSRQSFPYDNLIIDIGANDGFISSNSYNFIQWGWSAILVEPIATQIDMAKVNIKRSSDPYNESNQTVTFVQAVLSNKDGFVDFVVLTDNPMESHILDDFEKEEAKNKNQLIFQVPSMTVQTFSRKYNVPKYFGILSVDAEGKGDVILHQWMDMKFKPAFIIYEYLHNTESIEETFKYLETMDYRYLTHLGWNVLFEHIPFPE